MNTRDLHALCEQAFRLYRPTIATRAGATTATLVWVDPPKPQGSFGLVGDWVAIGDASPRTIQYLAIPFRQDQLGWVRRDTLTLFRFDRQTRVLHKVPGALQHRKLAVIYAPIESEGIYGLIGLHTHPLVLETIRLLCKLGQSVRALPAAQRGHFRDRICEVSLCAPDMERFFTSRKDLLELASESDVPDRMPPPLSRPSHPGETICERCHGIDILEFPDCHVLEQPPTKPCKQSRWENVGPVHISGAIRQVLIDPTDRLRLYAAAANGGVWRLDNVAEYPAGQVWRPLTDDLPRLRFRQIAVAPSRGTVIYAANSVKLLRTAPIQVFSEIYRSNDRGATWQSVHGPNMGVVHRLAVHPANHEVVFAATSTGLWRQSATTAGSWSNLFPDDCLDVALDLTDSSILYLAVRARGIFKSFSSGSEWTVDPILAFDPVAASAGRQVIMISLGERNADGTSQTPTARTIVVRFGNEICVSQTSGEGVSAWARTIPSRMVTNPTPPPATIDAAPNDLGGGSIRRSDTSPRRASEWTNCLAVDPFDPDHILTGSVTMLESKDGGITWAALSLPHEDEQCIVFDRQQPGIAYLANDGGVFSSADSGSTWPNMGLGATTPAAGRGTNLAIGLVASEFDRSAVRAGRCLAAIDHTGFILSEDFSNRWQFLFNAPDRSARHGGHENGFVYACPASVDRYYVFNLRSADDPTGVTGRLAQFDFTRTNGLVDPPAFTYLSAMQASFPGDNGQFKPEDLIYFENLPGPFAIQFMASRDERLLLFATVNQPALGGFTIQSLRMAANGSVVSVAATEAVNPAEPFFAITFVPNVPDRAFAMTRSGELFERDLSTPGQFVSVGSWANQPNDLFVSRVVAAPRGGLRLFALAQHSIGQFADESGLWTTVHIWPDDNETLLSLAVHPTRDDTFFLGTSRGAYISEDGCRNWSPYRLELPAVAITELSFDQGFLYAATFGRGLWRCRPCSG